MSTARDIVAGAMEICGAHSPVKPGSPENFQRMFKVLQSVLNIYTAQGVAMGITLPNAIGDQLNEPDSVTEALKTIVAVQGAPSIRKSTSITPEIKKLAKAYRQSLRTQFAPQPGQQFPDTLPVGSGNPSRPIGPTFYPDEDTLDTGGGGPITI